MHTTAAVTPLMALSASIDDLLRTYEQALEFTDQLWNDLTVDEVHWRTDDNSSAIGWHLGHQPAVAHFMVRNLTAAEPSIDVGLDTLMDSATPPSERGDLPDLEQLRWYRDAVADRVRVRIGDIRDGNVGAPEQLTVVAQVLLVSVINHEFQHSKWISEVRSEVHGHALPTVPISPLLSTIDGYQVVAG